MTDGVLPVDKPAGPTSHDVVSRARRALGTRRIGHTGTLDPFATGLLLLCVGNATRIAEYLTARDKRYTATVRLGVTTDTDDCTGTVLARAEAAVPDAALEAAVAEMRGHFMQVPPSYSAKKKAGRRAYQLARAGMEVELAPVPVTIHELRVIERRGAEFDLDVTSSSGTYIRAIARDIGAQVGSGAHLTALRRVAIGAHRVDDALPLDTLGDPARTEAAMIPLIRAMADFPMVPLDPAGVVDVRHGRSVAVNAADADVACFVHDGGLIAIGRVQAGSAHPRKVLS